MILEKQIQTFRISLVLFFLLLILKGISISYAGDGDVPIDQFLNLVLEAVKNFGGIPWTLKIASILTLVLSTMKVSFMRPLWDKLGWGKMLAAPILALAVGLLSLQQFSFAGLVAYLFAGVGAIVLHQMLDGVKGIPGVGGVFLSIIEFVQKMLKAPRA